MSAVIRWLRGFTLAAAVVAVASPAQAQHWTANMNGASEVPAVPTTATGFADLLLNACCHDEFRDETIQAGHRFASSSTDALRARA